jgi:hypothetical protein
MISKEFIVHLKGKDYPVFAGVLDAATKAGLRSLTTRIIQVPAAENGHLAVVMARAEFDDGRVFEDVGDCSPQSTSPQLASASLRLASTRAKGRVLRDSINVGQTMFEELPDMNSEDATDAPIERPRSGGERVQGNGAAVGCEGCGQVMTAAQSTFSQNKYKKDLCPSCQKAVTG